MSARSSPAAPARRSAQAPMPIAADRARPARAGAAGPCAGRQICRSPAALPPGRDLCAAKASISIARRWPIGSASGLGLLRPLVEALGREVMAADRLLCRRHAGSGAGAGNRARPGPAGCGSMSVTTASWPARRRRPSSIATRPTARASGRASISKASPASCRPTAMPASTGSTRPAAIDRGGACWAHVRRKFFDVHQAERLADRPRSARPHRRALRIEAEIRGRPPDERQQARQARPARSSLSSRPGSRRPAKTVRQERARRGHALCPQPLDALTRYLRRRAPGDRQQRRRTRHPAARPRPQELSLRRLRRRRRARRRHLLPDRNRQAQRP